MGGAACVSVSCCPCNHSLADDKQRLAKLDRLAVFDQDFLDDAGSVSIDFVQEFHRFDNAQGVALFDDRANFNECWRAWSGGAVEAADHRRFNDLSLIHI